MRASGWWSSPRTRRLSSPGRRAGCALTLSQVKRVAPVPRPPKNVIAVGRNYQEHVEEGRRALGKEVTDPEWPVFFSKTPLSIIGAADVIQEDPPVTPQ